MAYLRHRTAHNNQTLFISILLPELRTLIRTEYLDIVDRVALQHVCVFLATEDFERHSFPWKWAINPGPWILIQQLLTFVVRHRIDQLHTSILAQSELESYRDIDEDAFLHYTVRIMWPNVTMRPTVEDDYKVGVHFLASNGNAEVFPWIEITGKTGIICCSPTQDKRIADCASGFGDRFRDYIEAQFGSELQQTTSV